MQLAAIAHCYATIRSRSIVGVMARGAHTDDVEGLAESLRVVVLSMV